MSHKKVGLILGGVVLLLLVVLAIPSMFFISRSQITTSNFGPDMMGLAYDSYDKGVAEEAAYAPAPTAPGMAAQEVADTTERLIIKTGSVSMVVQDVPLAVQQVSAFATGNSGFVVSSYVSKNEVAPTGRITVRIPVNIFDRGVEEIKKFGDVQSEQVDGQDVTEEYVDLDSQLRNLRATEEQFLAILRQAQKIEDILAVQRELTQIRGQIEQIQGRMKYLKQSAQLATLSVSLSTDPSGLPVVDDGEQWRPLAVIKDALRSLVGLGKNIAELAIWLVVFIPIWLGFGLVIWLVRRWFRRRKAAKNINS
ncbi:MAG: hypothetical protein A3J66_03970 [Candidatus Magasanikbacteria bacterium RIFCSPHIGHO2_02_FULL_47_14]|uniref:DUF4349 domain-containing protein n=1 Tax=Candidatus Magasanikbacteria bacterium RIFCSPHIGHO2_02_FULL_47_14 TaxID=1798680 RepID=A0A1F6MBC7_9BACT|nr:MAG: hypothetical protein A3J66_03970 [Candidatus Magasanikbacteria bacterium RIFCSPHIGHO2_02_FULL_47_14]